MAITESDIDDALDAAAKNAARGVKSLSIGDRNIQYQDPIQQLQIARALAEEDNGGIYGVTFPAKDSY